LLNLNLNAEGPIISGVKQHSWVPFPGKLWQRNYYEHIVRNENEMSRIRQYLRDNPAQWATDKDHPFVEGKDHRP
jgi:REP element-mobilizing transposase RayT